MRLLCVCVGRGRGRRLCDFVDHRRGRDKRGLAEQQGQLELPVAVLAGVESRRQGILYARDVAVVFLEVHHDAVDGVEGLVEPHALESMRRFLHGLQHVLVELAVGEGLHMVLERDFLLVERLQLEADLAALHEHWLHARGVDGLAGHAQAPDFLDVSRELVLELLLAVLDLVEGRAQAELGVAGRFDGGDAEGEAHEVEPRLGGGLVHVGAFGAHRRALTALYTRAPIFVFLCQELLLGVLDEYARPSVQVAVAVCVFACAEVGVAAVHDSEHEVEPLGRFGIPVDVLGLVIEPLPFDVHVALRVCREVQRAPRLGAACELRKHLDAGIPHDIFAEVTREPGRAVLVLLEVVRDPREAQRHRKQEYVGVAVCHGARVLVCEGVHLEVPVLGEHGRLDSDAVEGAECFRCEVHVQVDKH